MFSIYQNIIYIIIKFYVIVFNCVAWKVIFKLCMIFSSCMKIIVIYLNIICECLKYPTCTHPLAMRLWPFEYIEIHVYDMSVNCVLLKRWDEVVEYEYGFFFWAMIFPPSIWIFQESSWINLNYLWWCVFLTYKWYFI